VKDDQDKAMEICKSAAAKPDQTDPTNDTDQPKP
jgi:hypothetical protein